MTQEELDRQVANATGETLDTISGRGFSLLPREQGEPDLEATRAPLMIDWDELDESRFNSIKH